MRKKNKCGKCLLVTGGIAIIFMSVCAFNKDNIIHRYYEYNIEKKYSSTDVNKYYVDDNFEYVNNYTETGLHNRKELIDFIYYTINSGTTSTERYIDKDYDTYLSDINYLTTNNGEALKKEVSILNNFVHPYNSCNNINIKYGGEYTLGLEVTKEYTDEQIEEINKVVDKVIKDKLNNSMPIKEKIKVIHDYIIDNTSYDKLKHANKKDTTYHSETAYGVLLEGYGTCNGYADAMAIFLDKLNVINYKISNDEHIWNLVFLDGKWYHLDLTWDDPMSETNIKRDTYFLIDTKTLEKLKDGAHSFDKNIYKEAK